jgi:hypothetical protein
MNSRMPLSQIGGVTLDRPVCDIERKLRLAERLDPAFAS